MKGISNVAIIAAAILILLALADINPVRSIADTFTSPGSVQTPEQMAAGIMQAIQQPILAPLWLLLLIIFLILVLK